LDTELCEARSKKHSVNDHAEEQQEEIRTGHLERPIGVPSGWPDEQIEIHEQDDHSESKGRRSVDPAKSSFPIDRQ